MKAEQYDKHYDKQLNKHTSSEENIFNRFGSLTKLAKRNKDMRPNITDDTLRISNNNINNTLAEGRREVHEEDEHGEDKLQKENSTLTSPSVDQNKQNSFVSGYTKEGVTEKTSSEREHHL